MLPLCVSDFAAAYACANCCGTAKQILAQPMQGVLGHTLNPVRQLFERMTSPSAADDAEQRFQHFKKHVWLRIKESGAPGEPCNLPLSFCRQSHVFTQLL